MKRLARSGFYLLAAIVCLGEIGCQLHRPKTTPARMIEPQLPEPQVPDPGTEEAKSTRAMPVRLLDTQARAHIGRHLLHRQADGELTEDGVWRWSSAPDRYLDTALRLELTSNPNVRLVDSGNATALGATLVAWDLESTGQMRLVGAVEFQVTASDRVVHTRVIRSSEPVSSPLPGDLAAAAGRLLRRLASEGIRLVVSEPALTTSRR